MKTLNLRRRGGFTLIELLVVIAIIALLSSIVFAALGSARAKARDARRIATARSLKTALTLFEDKNGTVVGINSGSSGNMMSPSATTSKSIVDVLVQEGALQRSIASDSVFGTNTYYLGICADGRYDVFSKLERAESAQSSSTLSGGCDGSGALAAGYNYSSGAGGGAGAAGVTAGAGQAGGGGSPDSQTACVSCSSTNVWSDTGAVLPAVVYGHTSVVAGDSVYLLGGYDASGVSNKIYAASTSNPTAWVDTGKTLPSGRYFTPATVIGNNIYIFGGAYGGGNGWQYSNILVASTSNPTTWTVLPGGSTGHNIGRHSVVVVGSTIYMFGGQGDTGFTNTIWSAPVSNPGNWTNTGQVLPGTVTSSLVYQDATYLYIFGGAAGTSIYRASVASPTIWTDTGKSLPADATYSQLAVLGGNLYLLGSGNTGKISTATTADPTTWTDTGKTVTYGLNYSQLAILGNNMYLLGGYYGSGITSKIFSAPITRP